MSEVTCRWSFALGTACGKFSRCRREIESYNAMKAVRDNPNTPSSAIFPIEELEAKLKVITERCEELEVKLEKAESVIAAGKEMYETAMLTGGGAPDAWANHVKARNVFAATIAELTGGKDE